MRIGIDLGGTKIEGIALDNSGHELVRQRIATPQGDYTATLEAVVKLVRQLEQAIGQRGSIGIGMPGAISPVTGKVKNANSVCLNGRDFHHDIVQLLQRPVRISNDANCFALSEASDGAAAGARVAFGVILGTGVGGGIVVNSQVLRGANAIGGEWGHNPLPWPSPEELPGPACYCGRHGCIETFLSGPGFTHASEQTLGLALSPLQIVVRSEAGDTLAEACMRRYEERLARALAMVINILDPDIIVLGGGLSNIDRLYRQVPQYWQTYVFSDHIATRLVKNRYGDSSGVRGAAWLWSPEE